MTGLTRAAQANSAGHVAMKAGNLSKAQAQFTKAVELAPDEVQFRINHAISLIALNRPQQAFAVLSGYETSGRNDAAFCSTFATAARALDDRATAALWYDRALALDPGRARALHGRARVAIERGELDAVDRVDEALLANPSDRDLWLAKAQALDVAGDAPAARSIAEQLAENLPQWEEGKRFLAQLRLAAGEDDFASHYHAAAKHHPENVEIRLQHASLLAGLDRNDEAAVIIAEARSLYPDNDGLRLTHAIYLSASGDIDSAEQLFAGLKTQTAERWLHEARHAIRSREYDRCEKALERCFLHEPWSVPAWALRDFLWRLQDDPRAQWLHGQPGLVQVIELQDADRVLPPVRSLLNKLHDGSPMPLGQSLRGGSQTRGVLFDRTEPELAALREAIIATITEYRTKMPGFDAEHPLLRFRNAKWDLAGSWSVRLDGGGHHHSAHIHPRGILSSALYCTLPPPSSGEEPQAGWLELGRPHPSLMLDLPPLQTLEPKEGHLALFPSTLYHGTRPFDAGRRMTVAFDVTPMRVPE